MKEIKIGQQEQEPKRVQGYLLGRSWYSADQGDACNCYEFPKKFVIDEGEAHRWLDAESLKDDDWGYGFDRAYIAPVYSDGSIGDMISNN